MEVETVKSFYQEPEIEYLDGEAYAKVSPKPRHGSVQAALIRVISACAGTRGLVLPETRFFPGPIDVTKLTTLIPDVAFVSRERFTAIPPQQREDPPIAPDIAVEVRSPSVKAGFLARKIECYLSTGAILVLDVDPQTRTIVAYAQGEKRRYERGSRFDHPAVPWLQFDGDSLFADLDEYGI